MLWCATQNGLPKKPGKNIKLDLILYLTGDSVHSLSLIPRPNMAPSDGAVIATILLFHYTLLHLQCSTTLVQYIGPTTAAHVNIWMLDEIGLACYISVHVNEEQLHIC